MSSSPIKNDQEKLEELSDVIHVESEPDSLNLQCSSDYHDDYVSASQDSIYWNDHQSTTTNSPFPYSKLEPHEIQSEPQGEKEDEDCTIGDCMLRGSEDNYLSPNMESEQREQTEQLRQFFSD